MRKIGHHPKSDTLASFASGTLDEAFSIVVATHLGLCRECTTIVHDFEALGGACLENLEAESINKDVLKSFWLKAGKQEPEPFQVQESCSTPNPIGSIGPLSTLINSDLDQIPWRMAAPGIRQFIIEAKGIRKNSLRIFKISAGTKIPLHSHQQNELTLILDGAYKDKNGTFNVGDLADFDSDITHEPEAIGEKPCICLIATNAPLQFKSIIGKISQPLIGL